MLVAEERDTNRDHARDWLPSVGWPLLLFAICVAFFWKLVLPGQYSWLEGPDLAYQVLPWFQQQARDWHQGRIPLWDPYLWGGQPLLAQAQPGVAYPLNWLLFAAPLKDGRIQIPFLHWYFVLIHFQAALFCYWLCRDLKRSHAASLLSGLAFALGGYVGTNNWPQMLNGAVWTPLVLLFFLRVLRGERPAASSACSGACLGLAVLSGHHQVPTYIALTVGGVWLYFLIRREVQLRYLFIFGLFTVLISAVQVLPAYEYAKISLRWVGAADPVGWRDRVPYYIHQQFSLYAESIFGVVIPGVFRHSDPFMGIAALTLALLGVAACWEDRTARLFGGIAAGGLVLSLGYNSVFHGVLYALVPMVEKARSPSMAIVIFNFGLSVLVAYGIDGYQSVGSILSSRTIRILLGFAAFLSLLVWALTVAKVTFPDRFGIVVLAALLVAGILAVWRSERISSRFAITSLALVMLLELGNVTTFAYPSQAEYKSRLLELSEHDDIVAFLRKQPGPVRVDINQQDVPYNFGDWHAIDHFGGYLASLTNNISRLVGIRAGQMLYAVNYAVRKQPNFPDQVEVFTGHSGVKVYRNPASLPWVRVVHQVSTIRNDGEGMPLLESAGFDARRQTFVRGTAPQLEPCSAAETVTLVDRESGRVTIDADLKCRGMVIDADTYYPGWIATVDNKPAPIYEAYSFVRGVVVEPGRHRIELLYRPKSVYWGAGLTALGLLGAVVLRVRS